ncbi:hypothetical protein LIER_09282 [Lithospermum erythrorhizon]|uniref:Uncharacterized protein n=1 Tax=Lithospermum erythrorhizon TaxID=34254 RepID=A0AAV3PHC3_LITER
MQRDGDGSDEPLALEVNGDYTRDIGYLEFDDYNTGFICVIKPFNLLNRVWFQPEEIFHIDGQSEVRQHALWIPADENYLAIAQKLKRGISAAVFVDNKAYREFLYKKFNAAPVDVETVVVALNCRVLSDLAGGGGALSNEADIFAPLASVNAVTVFINFISLLKETQNVYTS